MTDTANPYARPLSDVVDSRLDPSLASLGARLGAALLDGLFALIVVLPVMWVGGYFKAVMDNAEAGRMFMPIGIYLLWNVIGFGLFVAIQGVPLYRWGQTWGKRIAGIRIVDLDGRQAGFGRLILRRYLPLNIVASIPFLGSLAALVDLLLIFREDRRCGHDLVAGTKVVEVR